MKNYSYTCSICNKEFNIGYRGYLYRLRKNQSLDICTHCLSSISTIKVWKNKSPEEKEIIKKKLKKNWKNKSSNEKEIIGKKHKKSWNKKSRKEKDSRNKKLSISIKNAYSNMPKEKLKSRNIKIGKSNKKYLKNLSIEEKKLRNEKLSISRYKYLNNLSEEERERGREHARNIYKNLSDEKKKLVNKNNKKNSRNYWNNITEEEFQDWDTKRRNGMYKHFNELEEKLLINPNKTIKIFIETLNKNNIQYKREWSNKSAHKDFYKLYNYNPYLEINRVSEKHSWDFILYLKQCNVLVDIDGSRHDPISMNNCYHTNWKGNKYKEVELTNWYDEQRVYKTNNLDAFIIKAYNDNIDDNNYVYEIKNDVYMIYKEFINHINSLNTIEIE